MFFELIILLIQKKIPGNVRECEGMNLRTPKWTLTLGYGVLMDFWIFKK
jgi:hypothetical protein